MKIDTLDHHNLTDKQILDAFAELGCTIVQRGVMKDLKKAFDDLGYEAEFEELGSWFEPG